MHSRIRRFFLGPERGPLSRGASWTWWGLRIAVLGGLTAIVGAIGAITGHNTLARVLVAGGVWLGALGVLLHLVIVGFRLVRRQFPKRDPGEL